MSYIQGGSNVLNPATGEYEYCHLNREDGKYYRKLKVDGGKKSYSDPLPSKPKSKTD